MKGYILRFRNDIVAITNNVELWLKENNEERKKSGEEPETEYDFQIERIGDNLHIYL